MKILFASLFLGVPVCAQTATPTPVAPTKFDWKLRLKKGQKWTQRFELSSTRYFFPGRTETTSGIRQTLELHNEVLFANPRYLILRATFSRFEEATTLSVNRQAIREPNRSKYTPAFVGVPFKIKQSVDGRILEISGLDVLAKRGRRMLFASTKSKTEREELLQQLPDVEGLRRRVSLCQGFQVSAAPIAVGETASYFFGFYPSQFWERPATINRTLRFFDGKTARFDEERPRVPDQPIADGTSNAVAGAISGHTTVDAVTGLPQIVLSIRLDATFPSEDLKGKRSQFPQQEQTRITLSTKLEP